MAGTSCGENELWRERVEARAKCGESQPTGDDLRQYQKLAMTGEGENELRRERVATSCVESQSGIGAGVALIPNAGSDWRGRMRKFLIFISYNYSYS